MSSSSSSRVEEFYVTSNPPLLPDAVESIMSLARAEFSPVSSLLSKGYLFVN